MAPLTPSRRRVAASGGVVLFCLAVLVLAWVSYHQFEQDYRDQSRDRLQAIAEMKATEVAAWRRERMADARFYVDNLTVIDLFERLQRSSTDEQARASLVDLLSRMQLNHNYGQIAVFDADGRQWLAVPVGSADDDGHMADEVQRVVSQGDVSFLDLHDDRNIGAHMALVAPLRSGSDAPRSAAGAVVLRIDPAVALMPFLTTWPVPSAFSETLIVRREGDEAIYLNNALRGGQSTDLMRMPLSRTDLPAVRAVLGETGATETLDRRGVPVVAAMVPVEGSPWFMVASTARSELYGPLRERASFTIALVVLLLMIGVAGLGWAWRGQARRMADSERQLLQSLKSMAEVVEASPVVLFRWRAVEGWPVEWVSANVTRWGYSQAALIAGDPPFSALIHPDDRARVIGEVQQFTDDGVETIGQEYRICTTDGRILWMDDRTSVVRNQAGEVEAYKGMLTDITERRQLQAQFVQAQKMETVGRLAGGVAHDFNNLLTVINGYAEFALAEIPEGDPMREMVQEIYDAGQRASGLTRQLLTFSRRQVVQPVSLNVNVVAEQMQKMLERLIGEDIRLTFDLDPGLWPVKGDAGQLEQVLMNLAVNSRDAMPEGGTLVVTTRNMDAEQSDGNDVVLLSVADTGCGMDEATQSQLFEPFFTTKQVGKGTGLGLATIYGIVSQAGGRIECSSAPGRGTTFRVYLPRLVGSGTVGASVAPSASMSHGHERILVVEDEEPLRRIAQRILEAAGYTVVCAANGAEAAAWLADAEGQLDLLLTDVVMPGMSGHELAATVMANYPAVKIVFTSGYLPEAFPSRRHLAPDVQFLAKPYSPSSLTAKVRDVLDRT